VNNRALNYTDVSGLKPGDTGMTTDDYGGNNAMDIAHLEAISEGNSDNLSEVDRRKYYDLVSQERFKGLSESEQNEIAQTVLSQDNLRPIWYSTLSVQELEDSGLLNSQDVIRIWNKTQTGSALTPKEAEIQSQVGWATVLVGLGSLFGGNGKAVPISLGIITTGAYLIGDAGKGIKTGFGKTSSDQLNPVVGSKEVPFVAPLP